MKKYTEEQIERVDNLVNSLNGYPLFKQQKIKISVMFEQREKYWDKDIILIYQGLCELDELEFNSYTEIINYLKGMKLVLDSL